MVSIGCNQPITFDAVPEPEPERRSTRGAGGVDPETGVEYETVLILSDSWRERFANSEQVNLCSTAIKST